MKKILIWVLVLMALGLNAQSDYNTKKGYAAEGYDVVAYFDGEALEGQKQFATTYEGVDYKFSNRENLETFKADPTKYLPEYGGFCAYAVAVAAKKVSVNPQTFEIRDGKLYLFYNSGRNNTLESWLAENPENLIEQADNNWKKIKKK